MFFVIGGVVFIAVAGAITVVGLTIVDGSGQGFTRTRGGRTKPATRPQIATVPAFVPLDLGPVQMRWPSEVPWPKQVLKSPPWPSQTWTSDFFKRSGSTSGVSEEHPPAAQASPVPAVFEPEARLESAWFEAAEKPAPKPAKKPQQKTPPKRTSGNTPVPTARAPAPTGHVPADETVLAWVDAHGLADTVEKLRHETGWDFQHAAIHLSQTLKKHRGHAP
jgi:hypothetical protein